MTTLQLPTDVVTTAGSNLPDGRDFAARYAEIEAALSNANASGELPAPAERAQLKQEIIDLYRAADAAAKEYAAFKGAVKELVAQWKQLGESDPGTATPADGAPATSAETTPSPAPTSTRVDHLGASTYMEKGWSRLALGDPAGAETALRRALELVPGDNEAETLLGWAQMMQAQYDAALLTFQTVLVRDPQHALARTNVGYICLRKQIYGEAIEHLSRAIRADSDRKATLYAHLYLGMVYREREMYDDAELFFRRALELGPNLLQAWYELGRARWFAGRPDDAKAAWREGSDANKFNPWGKRCAEILAHVEQGGTPSRSD
jgi:tetratricopeptide (TPR) repeat protein